MQKTYIYLAILILLGLVLAFGLSIFLESDADKTNNETSSVGSGENTNSQNENTTPDIEDGELENEGIVTGVYTDYASDKLQENSTNLLFFYAPWCPSCRKLDEDLRASLREIPANLQILKVDYDNESELKQKYGITLQHTIVQVDSEGELINKINGYYSIYTLEELVNNI